MNAVPAPDELHSRGVEHHRAGRLGEAESCYRQALDLDPDRTSAWRHLGAALCQAGRYEEGAAAFIQCVRLDPHEAGAHADLARALRAAGSLETAREAYDRALALDPTDAGWWLEQAATLEKLEDWNGAVAAHERAMDMRPNPSTAARLGQALLKTAAPDQAARVFHDALAKWPDEAVLHNGRGMALGALGQHAQALLAYGQAVRLEPTLAEAWFNHGLAAQQCDDPERSKGDWREALRLRPGFPECLRALAGLLRSTGDAAEALEHYRRAVEGSADGAGLLEYARLLVEAGNLQDALEAVRGTLRTDPDSVEAWALAGDLHCALGAKSEGLSAYDSGVAAGERAGAPASMALARLLYRRATARTNADDLEAAAADAARLAALDPKYPFAEGLSLYLDLMSARWEGLEARIGRLLERIRQGEPVVQPWVLIGAADAPEEQLMAARTWVRHLCPEAGRPLWRGERYQHGRTRIAYVSSDFGEHPVGHALAGLLEHHDRSAFEVVGVSIADAPAGALKTRLRAGFDRFLDAARLSDAAAAAWMREQEVDIAINLNVYTGWSRPSIFAMRPSPLQLSFLGYPGTSGAPYIDCLVTDARVTPPGSAPFYSERLASVAGCLLPPSDIAPSVPTPARSALRLPENAVVLAAFHTQYKINPTTFTRWLRILRRVPQAILWLNAWRTDVCDRMRSVAEHHGVNPERLVFAARTRHVQDHLARLRQADLYLDALPYNAHSSAGEALRIGLPVLTCAGRSFAARVGASLLTAAGLPQLVTHTPTEFEERAVELAENVAMRQALRSRLLEGPQPAALHDPALYCARFEALLLELARTHSAISV